VVQKVAFLDVGHIIVGRNIIFQYGGICCDSQGYKLGTCFRRRVGVWLKACGLQGQ
jgi:hypothetical protein